MTEANRLRAESAEAENARLRARLEAVEALAEEWRNDDHRDVRRCGHDLLAALASPTSHTQQEAEVQCPNGCGWNEPCPDPWHDRTATTRADALAADTTGGPS